MAATDEPALDDGAATDDDFVEVPSCIESLAGSAAQLGQLALQADQYYAKLLICYGHTSGQAPVSRLDRAGSWRACCPQGQTGRAANHGAGNPRKAAHPDRNRLDLEELAQDEERMKSIDWLVRLLPTLNELVSFLERCQVTIESTFKRLTYYLNLAHHQEQQRDKSQLRSARMGAFQLTRDVRLDTIFVSLMDLMFSLVSLDTTLSAHTNLKHDLSLLFEISKFAATSEGQQSQLLVDGPLAREQLVRLGQFVGSVNLSLGEQATDLLGQCVEHVQHLSLILSKEKTRAGFRLLERLLEQFLLFYSEHLLDVSAQSGIDCSRGNSKNSRLVATILVAHNLLPTLHMTTPSRKLFGLVCLSVLSVSIFDRTRGNKKVDQAINLAIQRARPSNVVQLEGGCHLMLDEFVQRFAAAISLEGKSLDQLSGQVAAILRADARVETERLVHKTDQWLVRLHNESLDYVHMQMSEWPKRQILMLDQGLKLAQEISTAISRISAAHLHRNLQLGRGSLVAVCRLAALVKSIQLNLSQHELFISTCLLKVEHFVRARWRKLARSLQSRQISMRHSDRRMELSSSLKLTSLVGCCELLADSQGRVVQSVCVSMLLALMDTDELAELNSLLDLLRLDFVQRLQQVTDCSLLRWHMHSLGAFYNHAFEGSNCLAGASAATPTTTRDINLLHLALDDVEHSFVFSQPPAWSRADLSWLLEEREQLVRRLASDLMDQFKVDYLERVCQELDVELRLQTHRDLYTDEQTNEDLARRPQGYDFKQILSGHHSSGGVPLPTTFRLLSGRVNLNAYVEQYLDRVCYNLTAIAPHDWSTYDNMLNLARHKYQLSFVDTQLPAQTLDSGLDLLDIIRNLAMFAARYSYELTNQLFIEKCSSSRPSVVSTIQSFRGGGGGGGGGSSNQALNVLQSHHIARSIQTHGYGILDTAVNCTYQTLKRLMSLFTRQLADDKLRAVLQKEHQQMICDFNKTNKQVTHWRLPFERANRMARQFRLQASALTEMSEFAANSSPGQRPSVSMDLDSIRQTVTQLGNLLAFVRLVKSGALSCASKTADYVPDVADLTNLRLSACVEHEFADYKTHATLLEAADNFDRCLSDLEQHFSAETNYIKIIVSLFGGLLQQQQQKLEPQMRAASEEPPPQVHPSASDEHSPPGQSNEPAAPARNHLELFFLLVPALTINYIEYLIGCKERVSSRSSAARFGALLSDDGFALGVAFLLTVLGLAGDFNKLDWLGQTCAKLQQDIGEVERRLGNAKYEESLRQTSSMTLRRLTKLQAEYRALDYTLASSLMLFGSLA